MSETEERPTPVATPPPVVDIASLLAPQLKATREVATQTLVMQGRQVLKKKPTNSDKSRENTDKAESRGPDASLGPQTPLSDSQPPNKLIMEANRRRDQLKQMSQRREETSTMEEKAKVGNQGS